MQEQITIAAAAVKRSFVRFDELLHSQIVGNSSSVTVISQVHCQVLATIIYRLLLVVP
jgi:hypothetical protein